MGWAVAEAPVDPGFRDTWLENLGDYVATPADLEYYEAQRRALQGYVDCQFRGYADEPDADRSLVATDCATERSAYVGTLPEAVAHGIVDQVDEAVRREAAGESKQPEVER